MTKKDLIEELSGIISNCRPESTILVAVDGVDTSGKTTLADQLAEHITRRPAVRMSIDGFHNPKELRTAKGEYSAEGYYYDSFNYGYLTAQVFDRIRRGHTEIVPSIFDYRSESETDVSAITVEPGSAVIFDGVFLLRRELYEYWDLSLFLDISFDTVLVRAAERDIGYFKDMELLEKKYRERYIPGQKLYFSLEDPGARASLVIDNSDYDNPEWIRGQH